MSLKCKVCGCDVRYEDLVLGHLVRDVYSCTNKQCHQSILHYEKQDSLLPNWVETVYEYKKAN